MGSFLVAELTIRHLTFSQIFTMMPIPGVIAAAALAVKLVRRITDRRQFRPGHQVNSMGARHCHGNPHPLACNFCPPGLL